MWPISWGAAVRARAARPGRGPVPRMLARSRLLTRVRAVMTLGMPRALASCAGATRMRLERFSGAKLLIDRDIAEVEGTPEERALAKLSISITLQQRNGGQVTTDFEELEERTDVSTFDVPKETVGFLLGAKGATLRQMETNHRVFMFFNNDRVRQGKHVRRRTAPARAHTNRAVQGLIQAIPAL